MQQPKPKSQLALSLFPIHALRERGGQGEVGFGVVFERVYNIPQQLNLQLQMTDKDSSLKNTGILSLIRLKAECKIAPIRVDFQTPLVPSATPTSIIPSFNRDGSYFTPSFILPLDKKYYQENLPYEKYQFEEKIQRSVQETSPFQSSSPAEELKIAPPNSNYCQICQERFEDYFAHIQQQRHRIRSSNSEATAMMQLLCASFQRSGKTEPVRTKAKPIRKESKRQQRPVPEKKSGRVKKREVGKVQASIKGQNFSTCLIQDSSIEFKQ